MLIQTETSGWNIYCALPTIDCLIGATTAHHGLNQITPNIRGCVDLGLDVVNL